MTTTLYGATLLLAAGLTVMARSPTEQRQRRDIYAVTAPIVVEGAVRLLDGRHQGSGAAAPGEAFDAADVLAALQRVIGAIAVRFDRAFGSLGQLGECRGGPQRGMGVDSGFVVAPSQILHEGVACNHVR